MSLLHFHQYQVYLYKPRPFFLFLHKAKIAHFAYLFLPLQAYHFHFYPTTLFFLALPSNTSLALSLLSEQVSFFRSCSHFKVRSFGNRTNCFGSVQIVGAPTLTTSIV